ncbi:hypothetical protein KEM54_003147, partial [Ascosphaera aggregata]
MSAPVSDYLQSPPPSPPSSDIFGLSDDAYGICLGQGSPIYKKRWHSTEPSSSPNTCQLLDDSSGSWGDQGSSKRIKLSYSAISPISSTHQASEGDYEEVFTELHSPGSPSRLATPRAIEDDISNVSDFTPAGTNEVVQAFKENHGDDSQLNFIKSDDASAALEILNVSRNVGTAGNRCLVARIVFHKRHFEIMKDFTFQQFAVIKNSDSTTPSSYSLYDIGNIGKPGDKSISEVSNKLVEDTSEFKVFKAVLHPTLKSHEVEMGLIRESLAQSGAMLNNIDYHQVLQDIEAALINASAPHLILDAAKWSDEAKTVLARLSKSTYLDPPPAPSDKALLTKDLENQKVKEAIDDYMRLWSERRCDGQSPDDARTLAQQRSLLFHILMIRRQKYGDFRKVLSGLALKSLQGQLSIPQPVRGYLTRPPPIGAAIEAARIASDFDKRGTVTKQETSETRPLKNPVAQPAAYNQSQSKTPTSQVDAFTENAGLSATRVDFLPGNRPAFKLDNCDNNNAETATIAPEQLQRQTPLTQATLLQQEPQKAELLPTLPLETRASMAPAQSVHPAAIAHARAAPL